MPSGGLWWCGAFALFFGGSIFDLIDERGKVKLAFKVKSGDKSVKALSQKYKIQMDEITKKKLNSLGLDFRFN